MYVGYKKLQNYLSHLIYQIKQNQYFFYNPYGVTGTSVQKIAVVRHEKKVTGTVSGMWRMRNTICY